MPAVPRRDHAREDLPQLVEILLGADQGRAVVRQPHLLRLRLRGDLRRLLHHHVLIGAGVVDLVLVPVHALEDQKIRLFSVLRDLLRRARIRRVDDLEPLSRTAENHVRFSIDQSVTAKPGGMRAASLRATWGARSMSETRRPLPQ